MQTQVFVTIFLYLTYVQAFHFGFDVQWYYLKRLHTNSHYLWFWERVYRTINVLAITLVMYIMRHGSRIVSFLGCLYVPLLTFVYPAIIRLLMDWPYPGSGKFRWRLIVVVSEFVVGFIICFVGTLVNSFGSTW
ncbi:uncharacterized protein LOC142984296 [Anticarsia gemmatalis]|uniref:uncharacterized protein LOC142984296 n=1 Tax=Anticarsia gemmatalis TaxID=129554 RepID=UPI003F76400B